MTTIAASTLTTVLSQLGDRRRRLENVVDRVGPADDLVRLLREVDDALERADAGTLGTCAVCGGVVEERELATHPMSPYCLCALPEAKRDALERDLDLAWRVQAALLPAPDLRFGGWEAHYRYRPAGAVSGDYLDLIPGPDSTGPLHVLIGDVSGKGVAASFVMAQLSALLRTLVADGLGVDELVGRADGYLVESAIETQFATLVCAKATPDGTVELSNAGHCRPLVLRPGGPEAIDSGGPPAGLGTGAAPVQRVRLEPGESLVLYTDGITEALDASGRHYGAARLEAVLHAHRDLAPVDLIEACLRDVAAHAHDDAAADDVTVLVLRRTLP